VASLDTNCLLRWFLDDVPEQRLLVEKLLASGQPLTVDDAAIIEAVFALEKGLLLSRATVAAFVTSALASPITVDRALWRDVLDIWVAHPKLSVVDVYLAAKADLTDAAPLYTFDQKMVAQLPAAATVPA